MKKVFVLIPDGVGLKNFCYSSFPTTAREAGLDLLYWNQTSKNLKEEGFEEIRLEGKPRAFTDLYKRAKIESELNYFKKKFNDPVYDTYKFPASSTGIKSKIKNSVVNSLVNLYSREGGVRKLQEKMEESERKSAFYKRCKSLLEEEKPALLFCTNQRPVKAIAPVLAARDLGIPTCCFIFSWDNLPKATKVIDSDIYFVWSKLMKEELLRYYPHINPEQIKVTGSPQFEPHFNPDNIQEREKFFKKHGLDIRKQYLCFSGDDVTTSPQDQEYLEDVARAVEELNAQGENIGIIFRRAPVDLSDRYERVIKIYRDIITPLNPAWEKEGENWNEVLPTKEDQILQTNIIAHTFMVINLGSSMVFDYASYEKPCGFINYNPKGKMPKDVSVIYNYVHFRSMPAEAVFWINNEEEIVGIIKQVLKEKSETVNRAQEWFQIINQHPVEKTTERIIKSIQEIIEAPS